MPNELTDVREERTPPAKTTVDDVIREMIHLADRKDGSVKALIGTALICEVAIGVLTHAMRPVALALVMSILLLLVVLAVAGWNGAVDANAKAHRKSIADGRKSLADLKEARNQAQARFAGLVPTDDEPRWLPFYKGLRTMIDDEDARDISNDTALRIRDLHIAYEAAKTEAGRSDLRTLNKEAAKATMAVVEKGLARYEDLHSRLKAADEARIPTITRRFSETASAVAGLAYRPDTLPPLSASATLQRLTGLAENALEVDPDLVDSTGARVDALVRDHLPRLLAAHADAARSARTEDLGEVDATLADGVEQVRASIDEALASDARRRFDRLREEVEFLHMRRRS